ncbi:unnamed protein product [Paramecium sonneborni]|uniref:Uncharacterized protein n=1 Tax=Paramecium sonneborni TaxID=65129 RepID=A0A8S1PH74_9CILI|nr:unnamed protein product [Paramecium sonneborni]
MQFQVFLKHQQKNWKHQIHRKQKRIEQCMLNKNRKDDVKDQVVFGLNKDEKIKNQGKKNDLIQFQVCKMLEIGGK